MENLSALETVGMVVGLVITITGAIYGLYAFITRNAYKNGVRDTNFTALERIVDSLPCKMDENYAKKRDEAYATIYETSNSVIAIKNWIIGEDVEMVDRLYPVAPKNSPRELSWLGHEILTLIDGTRFLRENREYFFDLMDNEGLKTAYDVEKNAYSVCFSSTHKEVFYPVKDILFKASAIRVQNKMGEESDFIVDIFNVCAALGIPLRDMYLACHPEILEHIADGEDSGPSDSSL